MKLVALDLETTGLNPRTDQILQIGMALFESATGQIIDTFEVEVRHNRYEGDAYALAMNANLLRRLANDQGKPIHFVEREVRNKLLGWGFGDTNRPTAVGFNVAPFDLAFLKKACLDMFHHRAVELGTLLMPVFSQHTPVSSKQFAKHIGEIVQHTALDDCKLAIKAYTLAMEMK